MKENRISDRELKDITAEYKEISVKVKQLMQRVAEDYIDFIWEDGTFEHQVQTKAWKQMVPGLYTRSVDTISHMYSVVAYSAAPGVMIPKHKHPTQAQTIFVIEGKAILFVNGEKKELHENAIAAIEKDVWHSIFTMTQFAAIVKYIPRTLVETETEPEVIT